MFRSPEFYRGPEEGSESSLDRLDLSHEAELVLSIIIESGPELDPDYLYALRRYLEDLLRGLRGGELTDEDWMGLDIEGELRNIQEQVEASLNGESIRVMQALQLPGALRQAVEKIILARKEGLSDKAIYLRLARVYHPDQTILDREVGQETFKLIGQLLYDATAQRFLF